MLNHVHELNSFSMLLGLDVPVTKLMATVISHLSSMAGTVGPRLSESPLSEPLVIRTLFRI